MKRIISLLLITVFCVGFLSACGDETVTFSGDPAKEAELLQEDFYRVEEYVIEIPEIKGSHTFLQISDTHICAVDDLSTEQEAAQAQAQDKNWESAKEHLAGVFYEPFSYAHKISTVQAFDKIMDYVHVASYEGVLLSGDIMDYEHPAGVRHLQAALNTLQTPYLIVPGNHEPAAVEGLWEDKISVYNGNGFRIVAVDDSKRTVSDGQLSALKELLKDGVPTVILMHVPIATDMNRVDYAFLGEYYTLDVETADKNGKEFVELLCDSPAVRGILCGHIHGYRTTEFTKGKFQTTCSQGMAGFVLKVVIKGK